MDVLAMGYLAQLDRLAVDSLPRGDGDGVVGRRLAPSLTCDAPLVAMHLREAGIPVTFAGSHPGTGRDGVLTFLRERLSHVVVGPDRGAPFELEVSGPGRQRMWLNDPGPGVRSLIDMVLPADIAAGGDVVYIDSYPWLIDAAISICRQLSNRDRLLYVNFGQLAPRELEPFAQRWVSWWPPDRIAIQVSMPGLADTDERDSIFARLAAIEARYAIVTSGENGLGVSNGPEHVWVATSKVAEPADTSGAGAAVAAIFIERILDGSQLPRDLGGELAAAGARHCSVDGGLPARSREEWLGSAYAR